MRVLASRSGRKRESPHAAASGDRAGRGAGIEWVGEIGDDAPIRRRTAAGPGGERGSVGRMRSTKMSAWWMPRRLLPMKDVTTPRKALGTGWYRVIQRFPNGATHSWEQGYHAGLAWGALGELKHLSTLRNREDSRSSGERNGRSPNPGSVRAGTRCCLGVERLVRSGVPTARVCAVL